MHFGYEGKAEKSVAGKADIESLKSVKPSSESWCRNSWLAALTSSSRSTGVQTLLKAARKTALYWPAG